MVKQGGNQRGISDCFRLVGKSSGWSPVPDSSVLHALSLLLSSASLLVHIAEGSFPGTHILDGKHQERPLEHCMLPARLSRHCLPQLSQLPQHNTLRGREDKYLDVFTPDCVTRKKHQRPSLIDQALSLYGSVNLLTVLASLLNHPTFLLYPLDSQSIFSKISCILNLFCEYIHYLPTLMNLGSP